jgi:O-methyltransferase
LLAKAAELTGKKVFLADTFTGVVKAGPKDTKYLGGEHADTSEEIVRDLAAQLSLQNITLLKGIFPEETSREIPGRIALLHCDVDVYRSAQDVVDWAVPRLPSAGVVIFDDYGFRGCEGITSWVNELRLRSDFFFIHNLNGHGVLVKK